MASKLLVQALLVILSSSSIASSSSSSSRNDSKIWKKRPSETFHPGENDFPSALGYARKVVKALGCSRKPMICLDKRFKPAGPICCGWICVDVTRDVNHCGRCFHRCKYSRSCCQGRCKNMDRDVHNCGICGRRCPKRTKCVFGMCGYGE